MSTERVGILLEVQGGNEAYALLNKVEQKLNALSTKKSFGTISGLTQTKQQIQDITKELERMNSAKKTWEKLGVSKSFLGAYDQQIKKTTDELRRMGQEFDNVNTKTVSFGEQLKNTFNRVASSVQHIGQSMQVLGKTLTQISRPFQRIFNSTVLAAGFKLFNLMQSGLSGSVERYDTFATYEKVLSTLGYADQITKKFSIGTNEATTALDNLNNAVLGLPTGLDEIVSKMKLYVGATGDVEKATKAAIAMNNLQLVQGLSARDVLRGERVFRTMLAGGEMTKTRWKTISETMPAAITAIADALGYDRTAYRLMVQEGKADAKEFMDALLEVGTSGAIADATEEMKHTFSAAFANIENAFKRMGENVLKVMDEVFLSAFGKDTIDLVKDLRYGIDDLSKGIQEWIRANPEVLTGWVKTLKSLDIKGFLKGIGDGIRRTSKDFQWFFNLFGGKNAKGFGYFMSRAGLWGKLLSITGGFVKGLKFPLAALTTLASIPFMKREGGGIIGFFSKFLGAEKGIEVMRKYNAALPTFGQSMQKLAKNLSGALSIFGTIAIASGTGFVAFKSIKSMLLDLEEIIDIAKRIDWETGKNVIAGMIGFFAVFGSLGHTIGQAIEKISDIGSLSVIKGELVVGAITTLASAIAAADTALLRIASSNFADMVDNLAKAFKGIGDLRNATTGSVSVIKSVVKDLNYIYGELSGSEFLKNRADEFGNVTDPISEAQRIGNFVKAIEETIKSLASIETTLLGMNVEQSLDNASEHITKITDKVVEIWNKLYAEDLGGKKSVKSADNMAGVVSAVSQIITTMKNMIPTFNELETATLQIENLTKEGGILDKIVEIKNKLFEKFATIENEGVATATDIDFTKYTTHFKNEYTYKEQASDLEHLANAFESISSLINRLNEIYQALIAEGSVALLDSNAFDRVLDPTKEAINKLAEWFKGFNEEYGSADVFTQSDVLAQDVGNLSLAIQNFGILIDDIKAFADKAKELDGIDTEGNLTGILGGMIEQIQMVGSKINASFLEGIDFDTLVNEISSGIDRIVKMLERKQSSFETQGRLAGERYKRGLSNQIRNINATSNVNVTAHLGTINGIATLATSVANRLSDALSNINVNTNANVNVRKPANAYYSARGGLVPNYYANGGSIFKRRGTDVIPAMLTPNEYVQRAKAVKMFGVDFMDRVNNLDVSGAAKALYSKFGSHISNSTRSVVNNYNTVNNNQRVTQNVSTNNPNFVFKRSSRFVGAI